MAHPGDRAILRMRGRVGMPPRRQVAGIAAAPPRRPFLVTDPAPRLAARSAGATADVALLRAARTDARDPESTSTRSLAERLRDLVAFRPMRLPAGEPVLVARDRGRA